MCGRDTLAACVQLRVTRSASRQCGAAGRWQASSIAAECKPVLMPQVCSALSWLKPPCHPTVCWHLGDNGWPAAAVGSLTSGRPACGAGPLSTPHRHAMWCAAACRGHQWYAAGLSDPESGTQSSWLRSACHAQCLSSWPLWMIQFLRHGARQLPLPGKASLLSRLG